MTTMMSKRRPMLVISAVALLLTLGVGGCGAEKEPSVATADPGGAKASAAPGAGKRSPLRFAQCMRDQGLAWYPDPDAQGNLKVSVPEGTDQSRLDRAESACKAYAPWEGSQGGGPIPTEDLDKIRKVSQCMRDKGFGKYPDPDANGSITVDSKVLGVEPDDPAFQRARQECDKYMPAPKDKGNS